MGMGQCMRRFVGGEVGIHFGYTGLAQRNPAIVLEYGDLSQSTARAAPLLFLVQYGDF